MSDAPKLISKRVNFLSIQDMIDEYLPQFTKHFVLDDKQAVEMRVALMKICERILWEVRDATELGVSKGISEAISLMQDPDYYETVKKRRKRSREVRITKEADVQFNKFFSVDVDGIQ